MLPEVSSLVQLRRAVAIACAGIAIASATVAVAYPVDVVRKCRIDYKRLCPAYKLDSEDLDACMRAQHRSISTPCINALVDNGLAPPIARRR